MRAIELTVLFSLLLFVSLTGQCLPDNKVDNFLKRSMFELASLNYDKSLQYIDSAKSFNSEIPLSHIISSLVYITYKEDFKTGNFDELIEKNLDSAIYKAQVNSKVFSESNWQLFQLGLSYSVKSFYEGLNGNYLSSFNYGLKGNSVFNELLLRDSLFYEAESLSLIFRYWKREKLGILDKIGNNFDKSVAIKKLIRLRNKEGYFNNFINDQIVWILINEHKYEDAYKISKELLEKFPSNRRFMENLAHIEIKKGNIKEGINIYKKIISSYIEEDRFSIYHKIYFFHKLAMLNFELKNYKEVYEYCDNILSEIKNKSINEAIYRNRLERVKKLKEKIIILNK